MKWRKSENRSLQKNYIHMLFIIRFPVNVVLLSSFIQTWNTINVAFFTWIAISSTRASFYNAHLYNKQIKRTVTTSKNHFGLFFSVPLKLLAFKICQNPNVDRNVIFIEYSCCEIRKPLYISSTLIWVMLCEVSFNLNSIIKKMCDLTFGWYTRRREKK